MTKQVFRSARIILAGHDMSDRVAAWNLGAEVGAVYMFVVDILDDGDVTIDEPDWGKIRVAYNKGQAGPHRTIRVCGTDISGWVKRYDRITEVGEIDRYRLHLYADREILSINGTYPWEDPELVSVQMLPPTSPTSANA